MKKIFKTFMVVSLISQAATAQVVYGNDEQDYVKFGPTSENVGNCTYESDPLVIAKDRVGYIPSRFKDNWFLAIQGGFSSFLNTPNTSTDFSGRTKNMLHIGFGKWHNPYIGNRFSFEGFKFIDYANDTQEYQNYHVDLLINASSFFRHDFSTLYRWNVTPFIGFGGIRNINFKKTHFGLTCGAALSYQIAPKLNIIVEFANTATAKDFDGYGEKSTLGDNFLCASIGLKINIGRTGWQHRERQKEYIINNENKYTPIIKSNNYSGLTSLNRRLGKYDNSKSESQENGEIIGSTLFGMPLNVPILFFFKKGTTELLNENQLVNIQEIANYVKAKGLHIQVIGSADSQTGSAESNKILSAARAKYIVQKLHEAGVSKEYIKGMMQGGVNIYSPYSANRHTSVIVFEKK